MLNKLAGKILPVKIRHLYKYYCKSALYFCTSIYFRKDHLKLLLALSKLSAYLVIPLATVGFPSRTECTDRTSSPLKFFRITYNIQTDSPGHSHLFSCTQYCPSKITKESEYCHQVHGTKTSTRWGYRFTIVH